ncbi:MAG: alcohol dehydrogenase catalytic domain-containing protein [Fuerstiella sp.]|nr:alcohol dehydrogenase catalytic domain-containing protein [Fuerstiella sp.]
MRAITLLDGELNYDAHYPHADAAGRVEVHVLKAGICETDLQLTQGYMSFNGVLGHEFVGIAQSGRFAGRRVVGEINCACGHCSFCQRGVPRHCENRTVIGILNHDGAFADSLFVPEENLHPVPDYISTEHAVFTEPVAAACRILEQADINRDHHVVILGDGRLGNLCAQVISTTKADVLVVGKHDWKMQQLNAIGIQTTMLEDFQPAGAADFVVDCTGSPTGFPLSLQTVRPCGTVILKTTVAAEQPLHLAPVVINEVQVMGSRCGPFTPALQMIADKIVRVESLITAEYPLDQAIQAFRHAEQPDTLKVLLHVSDSV